MKRRELLTSALVLPFAGAVFGAAEGAGAAARVGGVARSRVRPGEAGWPSRVEWERLRARVGGRLVEPISPFASCGGAASGEACATALKHIGNPYYVGDEVALTQTSGWMGAWASRPSAYAVVAESAADVVAAVDFAREHNLRLVVKGGGHSYQGTSNAADSLLVWTRRMNRVTLHDAFVAQGCEGAAQAAVSIEAGAMWADAYHAVTTKGGRYVQGGGCLNVGVAGLVQSGGFGSCSKGFGTAAAGLIEAEVVTADGRVRVVNACQEPELLWALKGGGGGSFGVVTRVTLRTRELPNFIGAVHTGIKASSDDAFRALIAQMVSFYASALFNRHWGEQISVRPGNELRLRFFFQGMTAAQAASVFEPFFAWVRARQEYSFSEELRLLDIPGRSYWDAEYFRQHIPGAMIDDNRPGARPEHVLWEGDHEQVGWFIHNYKSAWLPASLLQAEQQQRLTDALFEASRHWVVGLHFNKGIAGAAAEDIAAVRDTAMNPQVVDAFALAIIAMGGPPAYAGMPGASVDEAKARDFAARVDKSMAALLKVAPGAGAYVSESDYFQLDWQTAFWGTNYPRLAAVKRKYDPHGLFFVHHGVGSEAWSADGFTRS